VDHCTRAHGGPEFSACVGTHSFSVFLYYVRGIMNRKKRVGIFWLALGVYAVWLTIVLSHAIGNNRPLGSLLVLSIVPPLVVVLLWRRGEKWRAKKS
jgi:hypothetical protein